MSLSAPRVLPKYKRDRIEHIIDKYFDVHLRDEDLDTAIPIYPINEDQSDQMIFGGQLDPRLPQHPFRLLLIAPSGTGKTTMLVNMLIRPEMYCGYFNEVYICSPSIYTDYKWKPVRDLYDDKDKPKYLLDHYDTSMVSTVVENQKTIIRELDSHKELAPRILLVFDDILAEKLFQVSTTGPLEDLFARGRQLNISVMVSSQFYKQISTRARDNPTNIVLMNIGRNKKELKNVAEELSGPISDKQFFTLWQLMIDPKNPHDFMHIVAENNLKDERFRHRFSDSEPLPPLDEAQGDLLNSTENERDDNGRKKGKKRKREEDQEEVYYQKKKKGT